MHDDVETMAYADWLNDTPGGQSLCCPDHLPCYIGIADVFIDKWVIMSITRVVVGARALVTGFIAGK